VVNELTNGAKHYPSVVGDAGGGFSAVWVTRQGSDQETILGRHFDPFGEPIGGDVVLHGPDPGIGKLEASGIASLADGKRVVGWDRIDSTGDNIWHVFGGLYSDFEMPVDSAIVLGGEQLENERWATVAAFGQGAGTGFVAVWRRSNGDSHGFAIIGRRFDLSGTPLGPEFQINETDTGSQDWPAVDGNLDGSFAVSWSGPGADGQQNGVWVRKFSANGSPETGEILANAADIPTAKPRNDVALLADGSMVTVWQNDDQDGDGSGVFAQRFSPDGSVCGRGECSTEPEHCPPDFCDDGVDCTLDVCLPPSGPCAALQITEGGLCAPAIVCNYLGCGGCADGNGVDWDGCTNGQISEFLVNTETNDSQYGATIGTAPDGRYVVAWISENQVVQSDIFAQLYGPDGNPVGGEFRVNDYYFGSQWHPGAAMNSDGKFAIVYRDPLLDGDDRGICARFYTADGTPVDTEIVVNQFVTGWQQHPVGTALADGRFLFAWESSQQDGSNYAVVARLYEPDGTPVDDEFVANTFTINRQDNPAVAALPAGGYVIVWESLMQIPGGAEDVFGTVFDNNSNPVSLEFLVNETSFSSDEMPQVAALDTGGFVVVWQAQIELGNAGIRGRLFAADGTPESSDLLFFDDATNQGAPAVIGLPDGRFAVFWYDGVIGESDARGRLFSADGSPDSDVFAVHATTESIQGNVMVSGFENSDFMAVWNSSDQDGAKTGIFAQRFSKNGIKLSQ
jgi:hypothetical protein